ncbi:ABC transporter ATP-binding protein [Sinorhizobium sp. BG8]|uniref:ABC transporter ATP-binding protein n=1 Tax=Sinorhizobium sp. BG8 TaxID=2613773 RepID=UPI00193DCB54|nr:ABC transporter ATP-binding protein [Sinorhizobium sp. BG8]
MLELKDIEISFPGLASPVLKIEAFVIPAGTHVAVSGPSGSGKSTLVNVITGLQRPKSGKVLWGRVDITRLSEGARDRWRGDTVGLVMQDFHLFPGLSALDNVLLPARLSRMSKPEHHRRAASLLERVGLTRPRQMIETMSRGEMQRVAIARALLRAPDLLIADEPTASLDTESGEVVANLLVELAREAGSTLIVISHDRRLLVRFERHVVLEGGRVAADSGRQEVAA